METAEITHFQPTVCSYHSELANDVRDVKRAMFDEDGLVATMQASKGAWYTVKWILGAFSGSMIVGAVLLFVFYVETPYKYAKTEDFNKLVTQQTLMMDKLSNMEETVKDLTRELKRRP